MSPRRRQPDPWPWPADTPLDRARRVARSYRDALADADPDTCSQLDARMTELGQGWVQPKPLLHHDNDLLTATEVADMCDVKVRTVDVWRSRGLPAVSTPDGTRYRAADVVDYHARKRRQRTGNI
ncbi:MAG: hypothetical protein GEU83_11965 [Pseudonocardiaceae bacterium]|nr:hypothetical protein [Pseudonocardiaceae bacterium]